MADSKDCRERAKVCIALANKAEDTRTQVIYFDLARKWIKMAAELERAYRLTDGNEIVAPKMAK